MRKLIQVVMANRVGVLLAIIFTANFIGGCDMSSTLPNDAGNRLVISKTDIGLKKAGDVEKISITNNNTKPVTAVFLLNYHASERMSHLERGFFRTDIEKIARDKGLAPNKYIDLGMDTPGSYDNCYNGLQLPKPITLNPGETKTVNITANKFGYCLDRQLRLYQKTLSPVDNHLT